MTKSDGSNPAGIDNSIDNNKTNHEKKDNNLVAFAGPEQIVYEDSTVFLEGHSFPSDQKLIWKQIDGPMVDLKYKDKEDENSKLKNPYFKAPSIELDINYSNMSGEDSNKVNNNGNKVKAYTKFIFELTVKDQSETLSSLPSLVNIIVKMVQRALVFQGGGSL